MANELVYSASAVGFDKVETALKNQAKGFQQTSVAAAKYDSSLKALTPASNGATRSLIDLGRIVQDAPFGFIGIANNINPAIESFQRLKTESGSTKNALKSLVGSLTGGGGLGLALSLITSAASFATLGFGAWTRGMTGTQEQLKKTKDEIDNVIKSLAEEQVKVDIIVQQIKTENLTRNQRIEAIKRLQQIAPEYFSTLDKEKATIGDITAAYDRFTKSILASIETRVREKELINITEKILKLQEKGRDVGTKQIVIDGKLQQVNNARVQELDEANKKINVYQQFQKGVLGLTIKEQDELENLLLTRQKLIELIAQQKGAETFNVVQTEKRGKKEKDELDVLKDRFEKLKLFTNAPKELKAFEVTIPVIPNIELKNPPKYVKDFTDEVLTFFQDSAEQIAEGFGETLGNALSGNASIGDFFDGIFKVIASGLKKLGKAIIVGAELIKKIKEYLAFRPELALLAGVALIAVGTVLENSLSQQAFATGTRSAPGGLSLVGERGPELLQLPRGSQVTPAAQTANYLNGSGGEFIAETKLYGNDILLVVKRAEKSFGKSA